MLFRLARVGVPAVVLTALLAQPAFAQRGGNPGQYQGQGNNGPHMPKPEEIQKQVEQLLAQTESQTASLDGFAKLTYKAIPTSTEEIGKTLGEKYKEQMPKNGDIDAALKQFGPQIQEALNKYLTEPEGWKFEALEDLKYKSKKIPKGEYKVSCEVDGESLKTIILTQPETKDEKGKKVPAVAIPIHFKQDKKQNDPFPKLRFELKGVEDKKTKEVKSFDIISEFFRTSSKTNEPIKLDPPKEKKDAPKKDETDTTKKDAGK